MQFGWLIMDFEVQNYTKITDFVIACQRTAEVIGEDIENAISSPLMLF